MKSTDLVFIGIKGSVVALHRGTGEQVWATDLKGSDFVNVMVAQGQLLATCYGEIFCLDPLTGNGLWNNRLKGFGYGLATMATVDQPLGGNIRGAGREAAARSGSSGFGGGDERRHVWLK